MTKDLLKENRALHATKHLLDGGLVMFDGHVFSGSNEAVESCRRELHDRLDAHLDARSTLVHRVLENAAEASKRHKGTGR